MLRDLYRHAMNLLNPNRNDIEREREGSTLMLDSLTDGAAANIATTIASNLGRFRSMNTMIAKPYLSHLWLARKTLNPKPQTHNRHNPKPKSPNRSEVGAALCKMFACAALQQLEEAFCSQTLWELRKAQASLEG